jgi:phospholipid/cholesterol/gamma-HCH transport system ATP-binding protein
MESNRNPAIRVRELVKSFGEQVVLNRIDLEVSRAETLAILGRSGAGKSVLLKLIIGLQKPDAGSIEVTGEEISELSLDGLNHVRKKIGFSFQYSALYDSLTVEENVAFPLRRHTDMSAAERRSRVQELLSRVGMEDAAAKLPAEISGGMKKRVGLARALALNPEIMLLDEPTAGLDPITAGEINDLLLSLQEELSMSAVMATHDLYSARAVSNRLALLHEGNILIEGSFEDLKQSDHPFVLEYLKQVITPNSG